MLEKAASGVFFDVVFMDISMPVLDGIEATKIIREYIEEEKILDVPVIALTANIEQVNNGEYETLFEEAYVKPIKGEQIQDIMTNYDICSLKEESK